MEVLPVNIVFRRVRKELSFRKWTNGWARFSIDVVDLVRQDRHSIRSFMYRLFDEF